MKQSNRPSQGRTTATLKVPKIKGLNHFDPDSSLLDGEFINLSNVDLIRGGYAQTRAGTEEWPLTVGVKTPPGDLASSFAILDIGAGTNLIAIDKNTGIVYFRGVSFLGGVTNGGYVEVRDFSYSNVLTLNVGSYGIPQFQVAHNKVYIFHGEQNYILEEFPPSIGLGPTWRFRELGMPKAPHVYFAAPSVGPLTGVYTYAWELVYKKNGVDYVVSTPNRLTSSGVLANVTLTNEAPLVAGATTAIIDTYFNGSPFWTHIRLYRSKRQDDPTNGANPPEGTPSEMYPIYEKTKADWTITSAITDTKTDDELTGFGFDIPFVESPNFEMEPIFAAKTGVFSSGRIFVADTPTVAGNTGGSIYYTPLDAQYSEQTRTPDFKIPCDEGDGQRITKLDIFEQDLIVFKERKTGRIFSGDPRNRYTNLDTTIGVAHFNDAQFLPGIGMAVVTSDRKDFKIFNYALKYSNTISGIDISRPVRLRNPLDTNSSRGDSVFLYSAGKLFWRYDAGGVDQIYVLHVDEGMGWSEYSLRGGRQTPIIFEDPNNSQIYYQMNESRLMYFVDAEETDAPTKDTELLAEDVAWEVFTPPIKNEGGRSLIEQRYLSISAAVNRRMNVQAFITNSGLALSNPQPTFLDPQGDPQNALLNTETLDYQYFSYQDTINHKRFGKLLYYKITGQRKSYIYSIYLYAFIQYGNLPPGKTFYDFTNTEIKSLSLLSRLRQVWLTRKNMENNQAKIPSNINLGAVDMDQNQQFILFKAEST